jgi:FMN phosphatase YigB (HAD superfamily)
MKYKAVLFDIGGVLTPSPFQALADYEQKLSLPKGFFTSVIAKNGKDGAWQKLERNELTVRQFVEEFEKECLKEGATVSFFFLRIDWMKVHLVSMKHLLDVL